MSQFNRNSAFYSGATRYGGQSAIVKRREASRRSFFATRGNTQQPTTSNNAGTSNWVRSITINPEDIIRRDPPAPQLTSSAQRNLTRIEKSCRFNPMAYKAPTYKPPKLLKQQPTIPKPPLQVKPAVPVVQDTIEKCPKPLSEKKFSKPIDLKPTEPPVPTLNAKVIKFSSPIFHDMTKQAPKPECTSSEPKQFKRTVDPEPVIPVETTKFATPIFLGSIKQCPKASRDRKFTDAINLEPIRAKPSPAKPRPSIEPTVSPATTIPVQEVKTVRRSEISLQLDKVLPSSRFATPVFQGTIEKCPKPSSEKKFSEAIDLKPTVSPAPTLNAKVIKFPSPVFHDPIKQAPKPKCDLEPPQIKQTVVSVPIIPVKSRFATPIFLGSIEQCPKASGERKFTDAINLKPTPAEPSPAKIQPRTEPTVAPVTTTPIQEEKTIQQSEIGMEFEIDPPSTATPFQPAPSPMFGQFNMNPSPFQNIAPMGPSTPLSAPPAPITPASVTPVPGSLGPSVTPTSVPPASGPPTLGTPTLFGQSLFNNPFQTPTMPPYVLASPVAAAATGSPSANPFQPTSNIRGRKILKATRRHR